ncbi:DUF3040 domain-containing protein [Pseudonocardia asaccharolytica]|uniref:DUF3040 domain-containing protein n=1 Tax=Pseudonocardia asaccharolytica DSM 44247 = NBRC 16224 TaxID=1123024 RepID=A0A511D5M2_9PSEU|nr:DUF3040 domain-containing protein [Pseudonocardia asaccharolytica]GEL20091.1 hypothetical protein PA7_39280 [Pseudonocardia asaccharolytica DSM 44247 = NBRC 16224]
MLSDRERAELNEIQQQLHSEDPGLVRSFAALEHPSTWGSGELVSWTYTILLMLASVLVVVLLAMGLLPVALVVMATGVLIWEAGRRCGHSARREE